MDSSEKAIVPCLRKHLGRVQGIVALFHTQCRRNRPKVRQSFSAEDRRESKETGTCLYGTIILLDYHKDYAGACVRLVGANRFTEGGPRLGDMWCRRPRASASSGFTFFEGLSQLHL